jgi:hypothetical protein
MAQVEYYFDQILVREKPMIRRLHNRIEVILIACLVIVVSLIMGPYLYDLFNGVNVDTPLAVEATLNICSIIITVFMIVIFSIPTHIPIGRLFITNMGIVVCENGKQKKAIKYTEVECVKFLFSLGGIGIHRFKIDNSPKKIFFQFKEDDDYRKFCVLFEKLVKQGIEVDPVSISTLERMNPIAVNQQPEIEKSKRESRIRKAIRRAKPLI